MLSQYVEESYAVDAVRRVARGGTAIDPEVIAQLMARGRKNPLDALTTRESEVLGLMAQGLSNTAIGTTLVVSQGAVEKHIGNIFAKLGLEASAEEHRRVRAVLTYLRRA